MAIILFMLTLAPWTIRLAAIIPVRKRLSLSYLPRAWKDYRRLERTSGAFWLLKTLVLGKLAADIFA